MLPLVLPVMELSLMGRTLQLSFSVDRGKYNCGKPTEHRGVIWM